MQQVTFDTLTIYTFSENSVIRRLRTPQNYGIRNMRRIGFYIDPIPKQTITAMNNEGLASNTILNMGAEKPELLKLSIIQPDNN